MTFALDLKKFADKTDARVNALVRKIVLDVGTSVVLKSPVGNPSLWKDWKEGGYSANEDHWLVKAQTGEGVNFLNEGYVGGRFRANWQYGLGAINHTITNNIDPDGTETIAALVGKVGDTPAGQIHYLTNSLPYAERLENGYSKQAPNGMVNLTVLEFQPIVEAAAKEVQ